jgi:hypothetical protein
LGGGRALSDPRREIVARAIAGVPAGTAPSEYAYWKADDVLDALDAATAGPVEAVVRAWRVLDTGWRARTPPSIAIPLNNLARLWPR